MDYDIQLIKQQRLVRRCSRKKLAELAQTHYQTIVRIERGIGKPKPQTVGRICDALGISMQDVVRVANEQE